jgi:lysozyme family protein
MIDRVIAREGGATVVNDPADPGKLTKYGIAQADHPNVNIAALTYDQAKDIYIKEYYIGPGIQQLPNWIQEYVFDFGVHSGPQTAIKFLQKDIGAAQDGKIGPETLGKLSALPEAQHQNLIKAYVRERCLFLAKQVVSQPSKLKFLVGWLARVLSL